MMPQERHAAGSDHELLPVDGEPSQVDLEEMFRKARAVGDRIFPKFAGRMKGSCNRMLNPHPLSMRGLASILIRGTNAWLE